METVHNHSAVCFVDGPMCLTLRLMLSLQTPQTRISFSSQPNQARLLLQSLQHMNRVLPVSTPSCQRYPISVTFAASRPDD